MAPFDWLFASAGERLNARREAGLLLHEHGSRAESIVRDKIRDKSRNRSLRELRLTLRYMRALRAARSRKALPPPRRSSRPQ